MVEVQQGVSAIGNEETKLKLIQPWPFKMYAWMIGSYYGCILKQGVRC